MQDTKDYIRTQARKIKGKLYYVDNNGYCFSAKKPYTMEFVIVDGKPKPVTEYFPYL
jgi:hypothetical protein